MECHVRVLFCSLVAFIKLSALTLAMVHCVEVFLIELKVGMWPNWRRVKGIGATTKISKQWVSSYNPYNWPFKGGNWGNNPYKWSDNPTYN